MQLKIIYLNAGIIIANKLSSKVRKTQIDNIIQPTNFRTNQSKIIIYLRVKISTIAFIVFLSGGSKILSEIFL